MDESFHSVPAGSTRDERARHARARWRWQDCERTIPLAMDIEYLADHPEWVPELADAFFREWGALVPGCTPDTFAALLRSQARRDEIPLTWVACEGAELLGTVSLRARDIESRPELTPWLGSVWVAPEHRGRGIGTRLVEWATNDARSRGHTQLYLVTLDTVAYYERLGWAVVDHLAEDHPPAVVMRRAL